jgi:prepilin-type N-terminal cleavage/methylation domain-containing protein
MKPGGERGLTLVECAAALAVAAIAIASTTQASEAAASLLRRGQLAAEAVDIARGLLEHEIGAPCAAPPECPADYRCSVARAHVAGVVDRVTADVARIDGAVHEELRTLAPAPGCGG